MAFIFVALTNTDYITKPFVITDTNKNKTGRVRAGLVHREFRTIIETVIHKNQQPNKQT